MLMQLLDRTELPKPEEKITLYGVTWQQYDTLVSMFMDQFPSLRMTFLQGTLEIMGTSSEHERLKTIYCICIFYKPRGLLTTSTSSIQDMSINHNLANVLFTI